MRICISVTAEHIAAGQSGDCTQCAVSLAVRDAVKAHDPSAAEIYVTTFAAPGGVIGIAAKEEGKAYVVSLVRVAEEDMPKVCEFINTFDRKEAVKPFEFWVEYPDTSKG
jgi:hypothetical protein